MSCEGHIAKPGRTKSGARLAWGLSGVATLIWAVAVLVGGHGARVVDNWESAATMLVGSFLAGSSPEGGGAVAFPVFTKALEVPAPVARTFGLSIQAVGMTMASVAILLSGRPIHRRAAIVGAGASIVGFGLAVAVLGRPDELFWPSSIGTPWVKASFSIVLATTSILMLRHLRAVDHSHGDPDWTRRMDVGLVSIALVGGLLSSLTGTGANILLFLFLVVLMDVAPKTALPTAILVMTAVSIVGFALFGVFDGQLDVVLEGDRVVAVGGATTDLEPSRFDLLGLWLAAVPVVVWGAPLGSLAASLVNEHHLVRFVALLAGFEVITTFLLVPELRSEPTLIAYLIAGLVIVPLVFIALSRHRHAVFGVGPGIAAQTARFEHSPSKR